MKFTYFRLSHALLWVCCCLPWYGAQAKVVAQTDSGFIVVQQQTVAAPPELVWYSLTNNIDTWWPKDHSWWQGTMRLEPRAGGCFCEQAGKKSAEHMRVSYVEPPFLLRMTGGLGPLQGLGLNGALEWQIDEVEKGSRLTLTYRVHGFHPEGFARLASAVDKVQADQLARLADFASQHEY